MIFLSLFIPIAIVLLIAGIGLAYVLQFLPFIIFSFGVIGWLIQVIEAMIAAPLVALGILHPEGHEIVGKAQPAMMMLLNVFMRPTLMIFGLIASITLSYAGVAIINFGFAQVATTLWTGDRTFIGQIALVVIYATIVVAIMKRVFELIHGIPDKTLAWIGDRTSPYGKEAVGNIAQEVSGAVEKGVRPAGEAMKAGTTEATTTGFAAATKGGKEVGEFVKPKPSELHQ